MFKVIHSILLCSVLIYALSPKVAHTEPIIIRFSHVVAETTPKGKAALEFKKLVEEKTNGKVKVHVYPNATLYKDKEELEALQLGAVQMIAPSLSKLGQLGLTDFELFDIPYIFPNQNVLRSVTEGPIGQQLLSQLNDKGIYGLGYWHNGFKVFTANSAIQQPLDMSGLRLRIQPSRTLETQIVELGAIPIQMPFSDLLTALKTGLIDGTENTTSNLYSQHMHQLQTHLVTTYHGYLGYAVIVNREFWLSLPKQLQITLMWCFQQATLTNNLAAEQINKYALEQIRQNTNLHIHDLTPKQREQWVQALAGVADKMSHQIDPELIKQVRQLAKQNSK